MGILFAKDQGQNRTVFFQRQNNEGYAGNQVETTKYTWYTFLPKAILLQFIRPANLVYLISAILQSIKVISSLNPITAVAPFVFVIGISLIRQGYQDYKRYKKDKQINERKARRLAEGAFIDIKWADIKVGDIIKVTNNQAIPADFLLLYSSQQNQICYVETANLDGETNLKAKFSIQNHIRLPPVQFNKLEGKIVTDLPNSNIHQFSAILTQEKLQERNIQFDNFMLRETTLRNTQQAVGVVIYAGYETKIVKNQGHNQTKVSQVERKVNIIQGILLLVLLLLSASCTIGFHIYHNVDNNRANLTHLPPLVKEYSVQVMLIYFSSFLLLTFLIPISLNVSIEVIKGFLGIFLQFDKKMYYKLINKGCNVNNVSILQELGLVDYVLTDKTGTLTANQMVFQSLAIQNNIYNAEQLLKKTAKLKVHEPFNSFWQGLVICHDVVCEPQSGQYQGSSPDQVCFINFAQKIGYEFEGRTKNKVIVNIFGQQKYYQLLQILPFDSRKRMSVIVRDQKSKKVFIYTKGADSSIFSNSLPHEHEQSIKHSIDNFAKQGFRTLLFSFREIPDPQYQALSQQKEKLKAMKTKKALPSEQLQRLQCLLVEKFESKLNLLGATAIEDKLQDGVPQTISRLQQSGIVVMMITGDKLETAQNIGYLANFIKQQSEIFRFRTNITEGQIHNLISEIITQKEQNTIKNISIIVEGQAIKKLINLNNEHISSMLTSVSSVIFCRSSPKQKGSIVNFIKEKLKGITLAIGDGGNDVNMIQKAHVGVGILGKQGNSASAASDFSIAQFKYLDRLLFHHGRWFYYRLSYFFVFYGWKNLMMTMLLYFYIIDSAFSAGTGLSQPFITIYNIIIGLVLVVYYAVFEQDINDDLLPHCYDKLPTYYKQMKERDLFSYRRYFIWTVFALIISVFIFVSTKYSIGSTFSITKDGFVGSYSHSSFVQAVSLSFIVIMIIITDIKSFTCFISVVVIIIITVIGTIAFFIFESYVQIGMGTSFYILEMTSFRFWLCIFVNIGTVYAGKLLIDILQKQVWESSVDRTIRQNKKINDKIIPIAHHSEINFTKVR